MAIDVTHVFTVSWIHLLPLDRVGFLPPLGRTLTSGWQFLNITTLMSGPPFTVYSGVSKRVPARVQPIDPTLSRRHTFPPAAPSAAIASAAAMTTTPFQYPDQPDRRYGAEPWPFRHPRPLHVPRAWLSQLRHRTDQRHVPCADFGGGRTCPQSSLLTLRFYPFK